MEPLTEKHRRHQMDNSFSDTDDEEDIIVHSANDGPSTEDRHLLSEEDEREKLLTNKRKILIGRHARKKSVESYMEDGNLALRDLRLKVRQPLISASNFSGDDVLPNGFFVGDFVCWWFLFLRL
jgi:hypothetical protein